VWKSWAKTLGNDEKKLTLKVKYALKKKSLGDLKQNKQINNNFNCSTL